MTRTMRTTGHQPRITEGAGSETPPSGGSSVRPAPVASSYVCLCGRAVVYKRAVLTQIVTETDLIVSGWTEEQARWLNVFAAERGSTIAEVMAPSRLSRRAATVRQQAIAAFVQRFHVTDTEAGHLFGRDRTTIRHACGRVNP